LRFSRRFKQMKGAYDVGFPRTLPGHQLIHVSSAARCNTRVGACSANTLSTRRDPQKSTFTNGGGSSQRMRRVVEQAA
jgi:hypothetical protein